MGGITMEPVLPVLAAAVNTASHLVQIEANIESLERTFELHRSVLNNVSLSVDQLEFSKLIVLPSSNQTTAGQETDLLQNKSAQEYNSIVAPASTSDYNKLLNQMVLYESTLELNLNVTPNMEGAKPTSNLMNQNFIDL